MPKIADAWNHHDWDSREYVSDWAKGQDKTESDRRKLFHLIAKSLPYDKDAAIHT